MRLHICEFLEICEKSRFLAQNVRFPAWVGDISRRGIERSNHERLSRVSPRSFGQIVNFLEKSKISKILDFEKSRNLAVFSLWSHLRAQFGLYDQMLVGTCFLSMVHVSKSFVCKNMQLN